MKNIREYSRFCAGENWTPAVVQALRDGGSGLFFPPGVYHFYAAGAPTRCLYVTNNDAGPKKLIFHAEERTHFSIEGEKAEFIFHDRVVPFHFHKVRELKLSGFTMDFAVHPVIDGIVEACDGNSVTLRFPEERFYGFADGRIFFIDDDYKFMQRQMPFQVYNPLRREMAAGRPGGVLGLKAEELSPHIVHIELRRGSVRPGEQLVFKSEARLTPGIILDECRNVQLHDLTLHAAGGMGVVAQNSFDLELVRIRIAVRPGSSRPVSVSDDGAHFANCGGKIVMRSCFFENEWDDAVNIHGVYRSFLRHGGCPMLRAGHFQQFGVGFAEPGEHILLGGKVYTITRFNNFAMQNSDFETAEALPEDLPRGTTARNLDRQPDVELSNCTFRGNKPRGVLCTSAGHVVIENNTFHTPGAAIFMGGDDNYWFEAGPVRDVLIRRNVFDNCFYQKFCTSTRAVIEAAPRAFDRSEGPFYHSGIRIEDNLFRDNHGILLRAEYTSDLVLRGNRWEYDSTCCAQEPGQSVLLENCGKVTMENNVLRGDAGK